MICGNILETLLLSAKCGLVLIAATLYRAILFIIFLSASVGPATLLCYSYVYVTGREPYPEVQPAICMMLISCWAEFSICVEKRFCSNFLEHFKSGYPSVMSFGRFAVHFALYVVAYCELYLEFEKVHTIPEPHKNRRILLHKGYNNLYEHVLSEDERLAIAKANEPCHVTIFLFALAYLVFVTSRNFHKDLLLVVRNLPSVTFSMLNNWLIRTAFAMIHVFVNMFYFLPCLAIAYTASNYKTAGLTTFFQLTFTAGMAGMIAALFELNRPWPQQRGRLPFLFYENNIFGKNLLAHALVVGILYFFYRPKNHPKVLESRFDSTNQDVLGFCLIVAFTTLHIVKFGVHAVLSLAHEYDQRMHELNNAVVDMPAVRDSGTRNQGGHAAGDGGMCARCIANMLNNNSHLPPPPPPPTAPNNDGSSSAEPQGESNQERNSTETGKESEALQKGDADNNDNNEITEKGNTEVNQVHQCNRGSNVIICNPKESLNAVNRTSSSPSNNTQSQRQHSSKNLAVIDMKIVNENSNKDSL